MVPYINKTKEICKLYELKTERGVVFAFDVAVQNGSTEGTDDLIKQVKDAKTEEEKLKRLADHVAQKVSNDPHSSTRKRKEAIANGSGTVNGEKFDLTSEKIDILYRKIEG